MLRRQQLRYALPSLAVATLYSYPVWRQVNAALSPYASYFRSHGPNSLLIVAALIHTFVVALGLYAAAALAMRLKPGAARILDGLFVGASVLLFMGYLPSIAPDWHISVPLGLTLVMVCMFGLLVPKYQRRFVSGGFAVVCSLALLPAIMTADIARRYAWTNPIHDASFSQKRGGANAPRRLIWVVLDEFDPGIAITSRPARLKLPVLDKLIASSVTGADVYPAGAWTREVIPAYLTGRRVDRVAPDDGSSLRIWFTNGGESTLAKEKTIFDRMQAQGVRSAATGWYNPICKWIGRESLEECVWVSAVDALISLRQESTGERLGLAWALRHSFLISATLGLSRTSEEHQVAREQHLDAFKDLHASGLGQVADPSLGFLFLHYNVPHPLGIYDSQQGSLSATDSATYLDNLVLADRVLSDLMDAVRRQGGLDNTAFLITSDHSFRPEVWDHRETWELEAPEVRAHPKDPRVLFLFHDPGDGRKVVVKEKLNAISGHDLALAWMRGQLQGHEAVASWLRQDKSPDR